MMELHIWEGKGCTDLADQTEVPNVRVVGVHL